MISNFLYFAIAGLFLVISGILLVKSLEKIARFLRISEFTAAFIIMAFATSVPELMIGISSAIQGNPALSLGNIIGANILDLTLITGIFVVLARKIEFKTNKVGRGVYFMFASMLLLMVLYLIGNSISRIDGGILLGIFLINSYRMFKKREKYLSKLKDGLSRKEGVFYSVLFVTSVAVLFISSNYIVQYAHEIAIDLQIPQIIIGLFLLSIATTLPELVFGLTAVLKMHPEMAIGDQIGTVFTNIALIVGVVALIHPITTTFLPFVISGIFMILSAFLFVTFIQSGRKLDLREGISLILMYIFFVVIQFFIK